MTKFESAVKVIPASQKAVYEKLSDLSNLEKVKDRLPQFEFRCGNIVDRSTAGWENSITDCRERALQVHQVCNNHLASAL